MLWALKGQEEVTRNPLIRATVDLQREHACLAPFRLPNQRTDFTPERVAVETTEGAVVEERTNPRAAFAGHTVQTPWDDLDFIYFASYAIWTYLTLPFLCTWTGFDVAETEPWQEGFETWRRLKVKYPPYIASHSTEQTLYFGDDGLLRRLDYDVEISGSHPAAHYVYDFTEVSGIRLPTKRRVYTRQPDNTPVLDPVVIAIDLSDIRFE
jgi:hypothetical protein